MNQDEMKRAVGRAALEYVPEDCILGVGTGSTVNCFMDALADVKSRVRSAVASSEATAKRLTALGIPLSDLNEVESLGVYIDGADEISADMAMIKGGGGALTREKIVAAVAETFVCIADGSKLVKTLGRFPLPVEVIPMARAHVARELARLGGAARLREGFVTDNGNVILDVTGLTIDDPAGLETGINQITGVVTNGLFARRGADVLLLATPEGTKTLRRH